jgi:hypothetical protein
LYETRTSHSTHYLGKLLFGCTNLSQFLHYCYETEISHIYFLWFITWCNCCPAMQMEQEHCIKGAWKQLSLLVTTCTTTITSVKKFERQTSSASYWYSNIRMMMGFYPWIEGHCESLKNNSAVWQILPEI